MRTGKVLALGLCWLAVMTGAETACYRLVRALPAHGTRHSAKTLEAWKVWGAAHPDWRPRPRAEQLREFDFACAYVELETGAPLDLLLTDDQTSPSYELASVQPPSASTDISGWGPSNDDGADEGGAGPAGAPGGGWLVYQPPFTLPPGGGGGAPAPPPVPEPTSLLLLGTGLVAAALWRRP